MSIERHPHYLARLADWTLLADAYEGERCVKGKGDTYLPATSGMIANGYGKPSVGNEPNLGAKAYDAYRTRAVFPDILREAVMSLMGAMHRKPMQVTVPKALESLIESATIAGEPLDALARRVTESQLLFGRCGLLVDVPTGASVAEAMPYLCHYDPRAIVNWDPGVRVQGRQLLEALLLDESAYERIEDFRWEFMSQFRVCMLGEAAMSLAAVEQSQIASGKYVVAVARHQGQVQELSLKGLAFGTPSIGGRDLNEIPFVFINATDLVPDPGQPPLLGLAQLAMAIYRGEADYRQSLFLQGQDTLVVIGQTEEQAKNTRTGAGAIIDVPMSGDAKFIGVSSTGLSEQRQALENDREQAGVYTVQMQDRRSNAESGEALRVRVAARTATLVQIQLTMAQGIKDALTLAGKWMGLSESELDKIEVTPNLDFAEESVDPQGLDTLMSAKQKGLPLSAKSLHGWLKKNEFTELEYDEEMKLIAEEQATMGSMGGTDEDLDPFAEDDDEDEAKKNGKAKGKNPLAKADRFEDEPDDEEGDE